MLTQQRKLISNNGELYIIPLAIFCIWPLLGVLISAVIILSGWSITKKQYYILFCLLALYLGLINSTKLVQNDLINYVSYFKEVPQHHFLRYIFVTRKEPIFFIYNYLCYYLTGGSIKLYLIITTFISYIFLFVAIYKYYNTIRNKPEIIIFAILIIAFFPQLFSLSAQVIRQFMAASIMVYAMVLKLINNKKVGIYILLAIFIHSTTLFFVPLIYFNALKKRISPKLIIIVLLAALTFFSVLPLIINKVIDLLGSNFITYALIRVKEGSTFYLKPLSLVVWLTLFFLMGISICHQFNSKNFIYKTGQIHFLNIFLLLGIFILANYRVLEISKRFFFFVYFFFPFIFPLFFLSLKMEIKMLRFLLIIGFLFFFVYRLEFGTWHYAPLLKLLFGNVFSFLK